MPIHVDIRVNNSLEKRIHIGRMTKNGMSPDSINEYSVVDSPTTLIELPNGIIREVFTETPTWVEWEEGTRFTHRYGDGLTVCVEKALEALNKN